MWSVLVFFVVAALLVAFQGFLLQFSCAVVGERAPDYGTALSTALVAALVSALGTAAFGCTAGVVLSLFVGRWVAAVASAILGVALSAGVYKNRLGLGQASAFGVALVHHGLGWLISGAVWAIVSYTS
jgi:hypothetical protein